MKEFIKKSIPYYLFFLLLTSSSCDKDKDPAKNSTLPEATQIGKNTIGFTLESGEVWVPYYKCGFGSDPCGKYSARVSYPFADEKGIGFQFARVGEKTSSSLTIYSNTRGTITNVGEKVDSISVIFRNGEEPNYEYSPQLGSRFTVTKFDRLNQVISGEFHLILSNQQGKTITLSNGRFDFKFQACECDN